MKKRWYESRTIWVAVLIFGASVLQQTGVINVPLETTATWVGMGIAVIQVVLRTITKKDITIE